MILYKLSKILRIDKNYTSRLPVSGCVSSKNHFQIIKIDKGLLKILK